MPASLGSARRRLDKYADASSTHPNTTAIAAADSPFGGVKDSGHGSEDGPEGVEACQVIKSISMA